MSLFLFITYHNGISYHTENYTGSLPDNCWDGMSGLGCSVVATVLDK